MQHTQHTPAYCQTLHKYCETPQHSQHILTHYHILIDSCRCKKLQHTATHYNERECAQTKNMHMFSCSLSFSLARWLQNHLHFASHPPSLSRARVLSLSLSFSLFDSLTYARCLPVCVAHALSIDVAVVFFVYVSLSDRKRRKK